MEAIGSSLSGTSGWRATTLGAALRRIESGKSVKTQERPVRDGELGIIRVSAVTWGEFNALENKAILPGYDPGDCPRPMRGDLLISRANTVDLVGAAVLVQKDCPNLLLSDKILRLVPDTTLVDSRFLLRALRAPSTRRHFAACAGGTSGSMQNISQADIRNTPLPLPPLPQQRRIAAILDKADAVRHKRKEAIALTEELLRSTFLEMFGDHSGSAYGKEVVPLGSLVRQGDKINYGVVQPGDECPHGVPLVRVGDFLNSRIASTGLKRIDPEIDRQYSRSRLSGDEVLIACVGATFGKIALADATLAGSNIARAVARVPCGENLNPVYLAQYLQLQRIQRFFRSEIRTVAQPTLNIRQIEGTPIVVPPMTEQRRFERAARAIEVLGIKLDSSANECEQLFSSLVDRAFSGEI